MPAIKKTSQLNRKSLSEIFNRYAQEATKDFPQLEGRLAILDVSAHDYHGDVDLEKSGFASDAEFARYLSKVCQSSEDSATSKANRRSKHGLCLIVFNGAMKATGLPERDIMKTLDHELGHFVVPNALGGGDTESNFNFRECAADVFSCLKHLQRFGAGSNIIDRLAWKRAIKLVLHGEAGHFTSFALEALKSLQDKIDFKALTPQQVTALSWNIAAKFSLPQNLVKHLDETFETVRSKIAKGMAVEEKLKLVADLLRDEVDYHTFKSGLAHLKPHLETGTGFKGKTLNLSGEYWDGVRKALAEKEARLAKSNVIKFLGRKL